MALIVMIAAGQDAPVDRPAFSAVMLQTPDNRFVEDVSDFSVGHKHGYEVKKKLFRRYLDSLITSRMEEVGAAGFSIAVVNTREPLFMKGYGYSDKDKSKAMTPQTLFRVASISKVFTGIAIMQLVQAGRIDLDAPLKTYIPDFSYLTHYPNAEPITVRSIMTHQSGLVCDILKGMMAATDMDCEYHTLVDHFSREYLAYPPGTISSYSNSGFALLAIVIENVTGMPFREYVKRRILNPCGMFLSNFSLRPSMDSLMTKGYDANGDEIPFVYVRDVAAADLISNGCEMARFMQMILNRGTFGHHRILRQSTLNAMFAQQNRSIPLDFPDDHGSRWGLSWVRDNKLLDFAGLFVGHDGSLSCNYSSMNIMPRHELGVIAMVNSQSAVSMAYSIADAAMLKALEIFKGVRPPKPEPMPPVKNITQELADAVSGTYASTEWGCVRLALNPDTLYLFSPVIGMRLQCIPHADDWFSLYWKGQPLPEAQPYRIAVKRIGGQRILALEIRDAEGRLYRQSFGREYRIAQLPDPAWESRIGQYVIVNPDEVCPIDSVFNLSLLNDNCFYYWQEAWACLFHPLDADKGLRIGLGRNINETVQVVDNNGKTLLYYLGYLLKKRDFQEAMTRSEEQFEAEKPRLRTHREMITELRMKDMKSFIRWKRPVMNE